MLPSQIEPVLRKDRTRKDPLTIPWHLDESRSHYVGAF